MLRTFSKAGKVFDLFSASRPEWGVSEVAKALEMPKSSACEILTSLAHQGLLFRTREGRYRLGWRLIELSRTLVETTDFYAEAHTVLQALVERWGETVYLGVLHGSQPVCIEKLQSRSTVQALLTRTSIPLPLHASSAGKVLLAHRNWSEAMRLLEKQDLGALTPKTITTMADLAQELEQVRHQGFACDLEEVITGLCSISAPVYDLDGHIIAAIGLLVPAHRFYARQTSYTAIILDASNRISPAPGYQTRKPRSSKAFA